MQTREPEDAVPAEYAAPSGRPPLEERLNVIRLKNFRTRARIVGVRISDDMAELWSHGFGQPHYPLADAHAEYEERNGHIVFKADEYELAVKVPNGGRKHARKFVAEFNTYQLTGRVG